jgi:hypothetical protein
MRWVIEPRRVCRWQDQPLATSKYHMNKSTKMMIACAAMAGLYSGALAVKASASVAHAGTTIVKDDKGKHDCKGKNSCKGEGGCNSGDNGCKGKNSCKGKGGCGTMDEKKKDDKK